MGREKEVKLEDIALEAGVSIVTVSNALKGKKGVSPAMREKIRGIAERMGYRMREEKEPVEKESYMVGVLVAERYVKEFPSFYMDIYKWVAQEITRKGSLTVLEIVDAERERTLSEVFPGVEVNGIIAIGQFTGEFLTRLRMRTSVPLVCVDYYDVQPGADYIVTDGYGGMQQLTERLILQGFRSFCFVGTPQATRNIMDRYMGYCKALEKHGLYDEQRNILFDRESSGANYRLEVELPGRLPEVFVCNCDKTAKLLAEKLNQAGVRVPEDVSVTGFDHYHARLSNGMSLTTYENDEKVIAQISVSTLFKRIAGKEPGGIRVVEGSFVEGDTVLRKGGH
ncbi:MAG: LacI family DNA-binding transcriptional regulator [Acetatifactor sp.]